MNKPESPKDRNIIKGAIMRAFSRSELHHIVIRNAIVEHQDAARPRVKTWCLCAACKKPEAKSYMQVDHVMPKVPVTTSLAEMSWDELVSNTWCDVLLLQALCPSCHTVKTKLENAERKKNKKGKK